MVRSVLDLPHSVHDAGDEVVHVQFAEAVADGQLCVGGGVVGGGDGVRFDVGGVHA